jgi:hypothetical protein
MEVIVFLFILFIFTGIVLTTAMAGARRDAKKAYLDSLEKLKHEPLNPDLREATLALGRKYAGKGVVGFDEITLMNDISAACARSVTKAPVQAESKPSIEERLKQLDDLLARQVITEQEHRMQRQKVLDEL